MGGNAFNTSCTLVKNGYSFNTAALTDTGANAFLLIDANLAAQLVKRCGITVYHFDKPIPVNGFNGLPGKPVDSWVELTLQVDHRQFVNLPFIITPLGNHDLIFGRKWLAWTNLRLAVRDRTLEWPADLPPMYLPPVQRIPLTRQSLRPQKIDLVAQADARRRDIAFTKAMGKATIIASIITRKKDPPLVKSFLRPSQEEKIEPKPPPLVVPVQQEQPKPIDIACISGPAFVLNMRRHENLCFTTNLYELDKILTSRDCKKLGQAQKIAATCDISSVETLAEAYAEDEERVRQEVPLQYQDLLDVFSKQASDELPPFRLQVDHKIELIGENTLGYSPLYRQTTEELLAIKQYLVDNLNKGFIAPSLAPFASPILFVKKPDGSLRFCVDYRKLNQITKKDQHPLPLIDETLARISKAKIFTKLDIRQAFHRLRIHPDSEELTTFRTRYGLYKYKVLPFGLTNGPAAYQRYMNKALFDYLDAFCTAYLDDILIYSENELEHHEHVCKVLLRLREAGLQVDIKKSEFNVTRTKYLGFIISTNGIEVDPEKIATIAQWQYPTTVRGVQSWLGFCNFYRRFIKDYGRIAYPLTQLTVKGTVYKFDQKCREAFEELRTALTTAPILRHYQPELESMVETDSSDGVIAGVLSQRTSPNEPWHPIGYFSKTMSPAELNYQIHDKEMLAIVKSFQQWRADLARTDKRIQVFTDHKALEYFMTTKQLNQRQARWAEVLSEFFFTITYRPGKQNEKADALTRRESDVEAQDKVKKNHRQQALLSQDQLDPQMLADAKGNLIAPVDTSPALTVPVQQDPFLLETVSGREVPLSFDLIDQLLTANRNDLSLQESREAVARGDQDWELANGLLLWRKRLVVPNINDLRTKLIHEAHAQVSAAHPGKNKTTLLVGRKYYWKGLSNDVARYVDACRACRRSTTPRDRTPGYLHPLPIPERPWQHITMDFKSFPLDKHGYDTLWVVIDRLSKQAISIPCYKTVTARNMAEMYIQHIYRHRGAPQSIVSDRGPQFISQFWEEFTRILGVKLKLSTAFHPQTDGQTEIMNQYIDQRLRPFISHYQDNWSELIPLMDYAQLTLPHESLGMSPFELNYGYAPSTSYDWDRPVEPVTARETINRSDAKALATRMHDAWTVAKGFLQKAQLKKQHDVDQHRREVDFHVGDQVYISTRNWNTDRPSKKLDHQMVGPYPILAQEGHSFRVQLPQSMKIYPVFAPNLLRKDKSNPLPGQIHLPDPPLQVTGDDEWEVHELLAVKLTRTKLSYRASWLGHDEDPEWYPASDFKYAPHKLKAFHLAHPALPGPPRKLQEWLQAWEDGKEDYDELEDDTVASQSLRTSFFKGGR
jgi:transposase InsO family protein